MYQLHLTFPILPMNHLNGRHHWRVKHKDSQLWDTLVRAQCCGRLPEKPLERARLTLIRHSSRYMDWDNLCATWKNPVDALVSARVLEDDAWRVIGMPEIRQVVDTKLKQGFCEMIVCANV